MDKIELFEPTAREQGWSMETRLLIALDFIAENGLETAFKDYLLEIQENENAQLADMEGYGYQ